MTLPDGRTFSELSAAFLPQDLGTLGSQGVVKLPDLGDGSGDGVALQGFFAPTGVIRKGVLTSVDARPLNPQVAIIMYRGHLGLESGVPQSVYQLDQRRVDAGELGRSVQPTSTWAGALPSTTEPSSDSMDIGSSPLSRFHTIPASPPS